jgi:hypothetical protein
MLGRSVLKPDFTTVLVDEFIADGWVRPEDRENEIAWLLQGNLIATKREFARFRECLDRRRYASGWIARWIEGTAR